MLSNEIKFLQKNLCLVDIWFLITPLVLCPNQADTWGFRGSVTWYCNVTSSWHPQSVRPATEPCQGTLPYRMLPQVLQDEDGTWAYKLTKLTKPRGLLPFFIKFLERVIYFHISVLTFYSLLYTMWFFVPLLCLSPTLINLFFLQLPLSPKSKWQLRSFEFPHISFSLKLTMYFMLTW